MTISHKAGEFIGFSEGEYSDYSFSDLYRVLVDFDMGEAVDNFLPHLRARALLQGKSIPEYVDEDDEDDLLNYLTDNHDCGSSAFGSYLMRLGYVEPAPYTEIHLGSYGRFNKDGVLNHAQVRREHYAREAERENQDKKDNLDFQTLA